MKTNFYFIITVCAVLFTACVNKELAFNEGVAKEFWIVKNCIDDNHQKLVENKEITFDLLLHDQSILENIRTMSNNVLDIIKQDFVPSDISKDFYDQLLVYITLVNQDYVNNLQNLVDVNFSSDCTEKKDSIFNVLRDTYRKIEIAQDKALNAQEIYFQKAELKTN